MRSPNYPERYTVEFSIGVAGSAATRRKAHVRATNPDDALKYACQLADAAPEDVYDAHVEPELTDAQRDLMERARMRARERARRASHPGANR